MAVRVRVLEKEADGTFVVQRENAQGNWIDVGTPFAAGEEDKAVRKADNVFARLNRQAGATVVYFLGG